MAYTDVTDTSKKYEWRALKFASAYIHGDQGLRAIAVLRALHRANEALCRSKSRDETGQARDAFILAMQDMRAFWIDNREWLN